MKIYTTINENVIETDSLDEQNLWIDMVNPTHEEISFISRKFRIEKGFITAALDRDENSRIKVGHNQILILVNIPYIELKQLSFLYNTIPLGIIITKKMILTVSLENHKLIDEILKSKEINTKDRTSFIFYLLYSKTDLFLKYLKEIENKSTIIEHYINKSLKNEELVKLLNLEQSLIYFSTSLQANEVVLKRLLRAYKRRTSDEKSANIIKILNNNAADKELLEDLISENKQAIILVNMYTNIFSNTMDAFASMISNNLNIVMKFLALITIALAMPTIVMSYYGMNVKLPFQYEPLAHLGILLLSIVLMVSITFLINKKRF